MNILISNDDGVYAPGLAELADKLSEIASISVVAPDRNRSGASNSLTLDNPLRVKTLENGFISVEGTPTDCVHLAITGLLDHEPDIVVSGINAGANLGDDVLYSGTVAAAREGRFLGLPAIAISLVANKEADFQHYDSAALIAKQLVQQLASHPLEANTILNVNVPDVSFEEIEGIEVTRLGRRFCAEPTIKQKDPRGATVYWVGLPGQEEDAGPGTDFYTIKQNKATITPLQLDNTHHEAIEQLSGWVEKIKV